MTASPSQTGGVEAIVRTCIESVASDKNLPNAVVRRLIRLADSVASGELDPSARTQMERRIELVINGFDVTD